LEEPYPYIILDARYERVRENGVGQSRAVLITLGIGWCQRSRGNDPALLV
jgi:transposase-like protein